MTHAMALSFSDVRFDVVDRNDQPWLKSVQLAQALGYKDESSVRKIYERNSDEFTDSMTWKVNLAVKGQERAVRIFSLRGAHLIAMFARTKVAKEFRRWVLDILDKTTGQARAIPTVSPSQKRSIQEFVTAKVRTLPEDLHSRAYAEIYARLKNKFRVAKYSELSETDYDRAIEYVQNMTLKVATSSKALPPAPLVDASALEARLLTMETSASQLVTQYFSAGNELFRHAFTVTNAPGSDRQNALLRMERVYIDGLMHLDASFRALRNNLATLVHI